MKNNKLQNVKAVKEMINGTHKFQTKKTTGFSDAESTAKKMLNMKLAMCGKK